MHAKTQRLAHHLSVLAAAVGLGVAMLPAHAQNTEGSPTRAQEYQRGVPGVDVDLNTRGRAATNGVPGVDMDIRNNGNASSARGTELNARNGMNAGVAGDRNGMPGVDVNTRASGAAGTMGNRAGGMRAPIQDRN